MRHKSKRKISSPFFRLFFSPSDRSLTSSRRTEEARSSTSLRLWNWFDSAASMTITQLVAAPISAEAFRPFGWVVEPRGDGDEFQPSLEPRLEGFQSSGGSPASPSSPSSPSSSVPRLYVMRLPADRGRRFSDVARHDRVTQTLCCLGATLPWLLAVARPGVARPAASDLAAFRVPPRVAVTLRRGTWHAGPLFDAPGRAGEGQGGLPGRAPGGGGGRGGGGGEDGGVDFLNLELSDTNSTDRTLSVFRGEGGGAAAAEEIEVLWPPECTESGAVCL